MIPIILSGGSGSRLWPMSRTTFPKQFLPLTGDESLFQQTCSRLPTENMSDPIVVCNNDHRFLAAHQLQDIGIKPRTIILEPIGRNTAPAIAIAALYIEQQNLDEIMLVLPADHVILDHSAFHAALSAGEAQAKTGKVVTFGIVPDGPQTGFGYIQAASNSADGSDILSFKEKPDLATAQTYIDSGDYYWNSGMFMFSSKTFLAELETHDPDLLKSCRNAFKGILSDLDFMRLEEESFSLCRSQSIDYAIMEKTEEAYIIPLDVGWSDLGAWSAIYDVKDKDENLNAIDGDVYIHDCKGSYLHSDNKIIAAVGLENIVVVDTPDAVLVSTKDRVQEVKEIVKSLTIEKRPEVDIHLLVHRPWGMYNCLNKGERDQVKRIWIYPGQKLSVQFHHKRSEHWVVVKGKARVTVGDDTFDLTENQSTYIPAGTVHSLENDTDTIVEMVEIQCGDYLGEDDIVRLSDNYGREGTNT